MSIFLRAERAPNATDEDVAREMVALADRMHVPVAVALGKTEMVAQPGDDPADVLDDYRNSRAIGRALRAAEARGRN